MMADLISRAAAIARIDKCVALSGIGLEPVMAIRDIKSLISVMPAVDAIPVEWLREKMRGYASALKSTETAALVMVMQMWQKEQEGV